MTRIPEAVTSGLVLWGVILGLHYHQSPAEAFSMFVVGVGWLGVLRILK